MAWLDDFKKANPWASDYSDDFVVDYAAKQYGVDTRAFAGRIGYALPDQNRGDYMRGLAEYIPQTKELYGAVKTIAGKGLGWNGLQESGLRTMREAAVDQELLGPQEYDSFSTAVGKGPGAIVDWAQHGLGQVTGNLLETGATMLGGAALGSSLAPGPGTVAGGVGTLLGKTALKGAVRSQVKKILAEEGRDAAEAFLVKQAGRKVGANTGLATGAAFHGFGETSARAIQEAGYDPDQVDLGRVLPAAVGHAAGEYFGDKILMGGVLGNGAYRAAGSGLRPAMKTIGGNMAIVAGKEIPVELTQTGLERYAAGLPLTDADAGREYLDTAAQTALFGVAGVPAGMRAYRGPRIAQNQPHDLLNPEADVVPQQPVGQMPLEFPVEPEAAIGLRGLRNPYDTAGYVSGYNRGDVATLDTPQPDLFGADLDEVAPVQPAYRTPDLLGDPQAYPVNLQAEQPQEAPVRNRRQMELVFPENPPILYGSGETVAQFNGLPITDNIRQVQPAPQRAVTPYADAETFVRSRDVGLSKQSWLGFVNRNRLTPESTPEEIKTALTTFANDANRTTAGKWARAAEAFDTKYFSQPVQEPQNGATQEALPQGGQEGTQAVGITESTVPSREVGVSQGAPQGGRVPQGRQGQEGLLNVTQAPQTVEAPLPALQEEAQPGEGVSDTLIQLQQRVPDPRHRSIILDAMGLDEEGHAVNEPLRGNALAKKHGLTRGRVSQILKKYGVQTADLDRAIAAETVSLDEAARTESGEDTTPQTSDDIEPTFEGDEASDASAAAQAGLRTQRGKGSKTDTGISNDDLADRSYGKHLRKAREDGTAQAAEEAWNAVAEKPFSKLGPGQKLWAIQQHKDNGRITREDTDTVAEVPKFSKGEGAEKATTVAEIYAALERWLFSVGRLRKRVKVFKTINEARAFALDYGEDISEFTEGTQGFVTTDGRWGVLVADNISRGRELGVFLHEVGAHLGLTAEEETQLSNQVREWMKAPEGSLERRVAEAAHARVESAGAEEISDIELIAYAVEEAQSMGVKPSNLVVHGWLRRVVDIVMRNIRSWLGEGKPIGVQGALDYLYGAAQIALDMEVASPKEALQFSRRAAATYATNPTPEGFFAKIGEILDDLLANPKGFFKEFGLGWLTLEQMADVVKSKAVTAYASVMTKMQSFAKDRVYAASLIDRDWANLTPAVQAKLSEVMRSATRIGFDPAVAEAEDQDQALLKSQYKALDPKAKEIYARVRDYYAENFRLRKEILLDAANKAKAAGKNVAEVERMFAKIKGPYFPLMRLGKWYSVGMSNELADLMDKKDAGTASDAELKRIDTLRKDEKHYVTRGHETRREALRSERELRSLMGNARSNRAEERLGQEIAKMPDLARVEDYIGADLPASARDQVRSLMAQMYFDMMPESSDLKRLMRREGIAGEETDMRRVFAASAISGAHHLSRLKYANDLSNAMVAVRNDGRKDETKRMVANELDMRTKLAMERSDNPIIDKLIQGSYFAHLGLSPAFILTNMTQVPMITAPWLGARYGFPASGRAIASAYADMVRLIKTTYADGDWRSELKWDGQLSQDESKLFHTLMDMNLLDITMEHDLTAVADMSHSKLDDYTKMASLPVHVTELANRGVTALAAYRLARTQKKMSYDDAVAHAAKAISETQLNYSGLNAPRHMQAVLGSKPLARLMFQFRKYQQGMIYLVAKNAYDALKAADPKERKVARDTLIGLFGTTGLMAGALGMPFAGGVTWLANAVAAAFGDDDDPFDAEEWFRNTLTDALGADAATAVAKGLPTLINMDLSKRVGMGDIGSPLPFMRTGNNGPETVNNALGAAIGPAVGTMATMWDGIGDLADGNLAKGAEKVVPLKLAQNLFRTYRYSTEGMTTKRGEIILPEEKFSTWDLALRAAGFQPTLESGYYEANTAVENARKAASDVRNGLLREYAQARMKGGDVASVEGDIAEFNARHPEEGVRIDRSSLLRAVQERRKQVESRNDAGLKVDKRTQPFLERARFAGE